MRFVSLFSGVGGFDLGLEAAGWECVAQVEWDQHCQAVLARHWPDVPKWHDVSDVLGADLPAADAVVFGSPCQDLSVAGKRAGFDGERSVLFYEAIRIIKEMQDAGRGPAWVVWENVVGALSSSQGRDFAAVLDALADIGALDIAWRVLDARFFGVPQRRRRVFVVADLAGHRAREVFAEPEGVRWHPYPSLAPWATAAAATGSGAEGGGTVFGESQFGGYTHGVTTLRASDDEKPRNVIVAATLNSGGNAGGFRSEPGEHLVVGSLQARMHKGHNAENAADRHLVVVNAAQAVSENQRGELLLTDYSHQLTTGGGKPGQGYPAVFTFAMQPDDCGTHAGALRIVPTDVAPTIAATDGVKSTDQGLRVATSTIVRRLTPVECERLMGWPDDHTRWRADGTEVADSHRYRMCGNGVAAVVAQWLGERISEAQR